MALLGKSLEYIMFQTLFKNYNIGTIVNFVYTQKYSYGKIR